MNAYFSGRVDRPTPEKFCMKGLVSAIPIQIAAGVRIFDEPPDFAGLLHGMLDGSHSIFSFKLGISSRGLGQAYSFSKCVEYPCMGFLARARQEPLACHNDFDGSRARIKLASAGGNRGLAGL